MSCDRHKWKALPGTERDWPVKGPNGARIIRYDRYQEYQCTKCFYIAHRPVKKDSE